MLLDRDPRWLRLHDHAWTCPCCGLKHAGLFDLVSARPHPWPGGEEARPNSEILTSSNILTEDFCILNGEHFFVRCLLRLPIVTKPGISFGFGIWATLSRANFDLYLDTFDSGEQDDLGPWFGWFSNRLNGYPDTLYLKCHVQPRAGRQRPFVQLEPTQHPLAIEQRDGITFDRVLEIYALNGHDLRVALSD
jgi:hypothetical protein